jgi:hypothetical protein
MSKNNKFSLKLAKKVHSLACNISGVFCATMKSAMPE